MDNFMQMTMQFDPVFEPAHYMNNGLEVIDVIERVVEGLPPVKAYALGNVIKYVMRAGKKGVDPYEDLAKANNYAHRAVTGHWRSFDDEESRQDIYLLGVR